MNVEIRHATDRDLPGLVDIYNHYVTHTSVTFDTKTFSAEEKRAWFEGFCTDGPYRLLVAAGGDYVAGYASSSRFKRRDAYKTSVETTIYLHPDYCGSGTGRALYGELIKLLKLDPRLHRAYAGIAMPNDASVALHERLGFRHSGTFRQVGFKFDQYWDVGWYECELDEQA